MSLQQTPFAFVFSQGTDEQFSFGNADSSFDDRTIDPVNLLRSRIDDLPAQLLLGPRRHLQVPEMSWDMIPRQEIGFQCRSSPQANPSAEAPARQWALHTLAQQPLHQYMALWGAESPQHMVPTDYFDFGDITSSPANPPAEVPARQGAATIPVQHQLHQDIAAPQPETEFDRAMVPENSTDFFPPAERVTDAGPRVLFQPVNARTRMEMTADGQQMGEKKKLGPRGQKRAAAEAVDSDAVEPSAKKSARPGPRKADPGKPSIVKCYTLHQRRCDMAVGCKEDCPLRSDYPDVWDKKSREQKTIWVNGEKHFTSGLWIWMWENANNRKDKRR